MTAMNHSDVRVHGPDGAILRIDSDVVSARTSAASHRVDVVPAGFSEPDTRDHMILVESSGTLAFWDDPDEDVYSPDDVEAV